ncbi:DUF397 domain-containing protein [Streptomyces sp. NBC_01455]|uniref:DUF397 domain-containing protein n=1 Tax=Streptomyces sp. NBC_01455 TaxID=2903874 RepID=UPI002E319BC5|nr:DUF397 domain-containing protein [Streptomyces sp. NBC_01455]
MTDHKKSVGTKLTPEGAWFKSSYSDQSGGNCVEVADLTDEVGIRDSKVGNGPALFVGKAPWNAFISNVTA